MRADVWNTVDAVQDASNFPQSRSRNSSSSSSGGGDGSNSSHRSSSSKAHRPKFSEEVRRTAFLSCVVGTICFLSLSHLSSHVFVHLLRYLAHVPAAQGHAVARVSYALSTDTPSGAAAASASVGGARTRSSAWSIPGFKLMVLVVSVVLLLVVVMPPRWSRESKRCSAGEAASGGFCALSGSRVVRQVQNHRTSNGAGLSQFRRALAEIFLFLLPRHKTRRKGEREGGRGREGI